MPGLTALPGSAAELTNSAVIPVMVKVYVVPAIGASTNSLQPVYTYETTVQR